MRDTMNSRSSVEDETLLKQTHNFWLKKYWNIRWFNLQFVQKRPKYVTQFFHVAF